MTTGKLGLCPKCKRFGVSVTLSRKHCQFCDYEVLAKHEGKDRDCAFDYRNPDCRDVRSGV